MYLLVYSHPEEAVTRAIRAHADRLDRPLVAVSLADLLEAATIFDRIDNGVPTLGWDVPGLPHVTNGPDVLLVNRVIGIPPELFDSFAPEDREYARTEFHAYLSFALAAFPRATARPGYFGLAGPQYPLPHQWRLAREACPEVAVPRYYLGPKSRCPLLARSDTVYGQLHDYYQWRPQAEPPEAAHLFAYTRPAGDPVSVFVAGDRALVTALAGTAPSREVSDRLITATRALAATAGTSFAEALYFVERDGAAFAMLNTISCGCAGKPGFDDVVLGGLAAAFGGPRGETHVHSA